MEADVQIKYNHLVVVTTNLSSDVQSEAFHVAIRVSFSLSYLLNFLNLKFWDYFSRIYLKQYKYQRSKGSFWPVLQPISWT